MSSSSNGGSSWASFLKSVGSFNGDLSSLTAPPFILSGKSLTEFSAYWAEHPSLLVAPALEPDPEKRALAVLKWFISTLHQQYCSRSEQYGREKKPLNPFLGELFIGKWEDDGQTGETVLHAEQVSHHPPVTAYVIENNKHKVQLQGYNGQKASFFKTLRVEQLGHALLTLTPPATAEIPNPEIETYLITLPSLHIESLLSWNPFVELEKSSYIASSTGFMAKIDYSGRGWLSGKKNTVLASLYRNSTGPDSPLYQVEGQWSKAFTIYDTRNGTGDSSRKEIDKYDASSNPTQPLKVAPIEQQDLVESRRAWKDVASAIDKEDMSATSAAKSRIEVAQRELRKQEKAENREWQRCFFRKALPSEDPAFLQVAEMIPYTEYQDHEKGSGFWRTNAEALLTKTHPPYYPQEERLLGLDNKKHSSPDKQQA